MCFSDWLVWVKLSALEPGGGASPSGASEFENKGSVDPQNIMGVLGSQSNRLPLRRHQCVFLRLVQEDQLIWDPGCKTCGKRSRELLFVGCDQSLATRQASGS